MRTFVALIILTIIGSTHKLMADVITQPVDSIQLTRDGESVTTALTFRPVLLHLSDDQVALIEPKIAGSTDTVTLPTLAVYGRSHYYHIVRGGTNIFQEPGNHMIRHKRLPNRIEYAANAEYRQWMDTAKVIVTLYIYNECGDNVEGISPREFVRHPKIIFRQGKATMETVADKASGTAYIDFVVNQTELLPDLHDNQRELEKIKHTIDSVLSDTTAVLTRMTVTGYASPEGPYDKNIILASGRSETLSNYISTEFKIPREKIETQFVPEDWAGLRRYVDTTSVLQHRQEILAMIDSVFDPDVKLNTIRKTFPVDWQQIALNALPYLRHSDYTIEYEHRTMVWHTADIDTLYEIPRTPDGLVPSPRLPLGKVVRPWIALKTNMLFDLALTPNFEIEVPFGKEKRWSIMAEDWFPWWLHKRNPLGDDNRYRREGEKAFRRSYELWTVGLELRYWFRPKCEPIHPLLTGTFFGVYAAGGKYDWEWNSVGDQGEFTSLGLTFGHSWVLAQRWNLELSGSVGYVGGPRRHYNAEFDDTHLIYRYSSRIRYVGPTKLKLSLVWLLGNNRKGGRL